MRPYDLDWTQIIRGSGWDRASLLFVRAIIDARLAELDQPPVRCRAIIKKQ